MTTSLTKGANAPLQNAHIRVVLSWGGDLDVDVAALLCAADGKVRTDVDFVFYNQPIHPSTAVSHEGKLRGPISTDTLEVNLDRVEAAIDKVVISSSVDRGNFGGLHTISVSVTDPKTDAAILEFEVKDASVETAMIVCELYRRNGTWKFRAVGQGYSTGLRGVASDFGITVDDDIAELDSSSSQQFSPPANSGGRDSAPALPSSIAAQPQTASPRPPEHHPPRAQPAGSPLDPNYQHQSPPLPDTTHTESGNAPSHRSHSYISPPEPHWPAPVAVLPASGSTTAQRDASQASNVDREPTNQPPSEHRQPERSSEPAHLGVAKFRDQSLAGKTRKARGAWSKAWDNVQQALPDKEKILAVVFAHEWPEFDGTMTQGDIAWSGELLLTEERFVQIRPDGIDQIRLSDIGGFNYHEFRFGVTKVACTLILTSGARQSHVFSLPDKVKESRAFMAEVKSIMDGRPTVKFD